jgi:hypothetical protein
LPISNTRTFSSITSTQRSACEHSAAYLTELAASVGAAGLDVAADTPICMAADEVGNSIDHVKPDLKASYTQRYFERLQPFVRRAHEVP